MKYKIYLTLLISCIVLFANGQEKKYDVIDSTTNRIIDIYWMAMDGSISDDKIDDLETFNLYVGAEWKEFFNEKIRLDIGLHFAVSAFSYENRDTYKSESTWAIGPRVNIRAHYPLIYRTSVRPLKVKTAAESNYTYTTVHYKKIPTIRRNFLNVHGGFYTSSIEQKVMAGLNFTQMLFANVNMGKRNKKVLHYIDFGVEAVYVLAYSDYINREYNLIGEEAPTLGVNAYFSWTPNFAENMKIVFDIGHVRGVTINLGGVIAIPILKK